LGETTTLGGRRGVNLVAMSAVAPTAVHARITDAAEAAGVRVYLHALDLESGEEVGVDADELVVLASVFKVPIAVELARQFGAGRLVPGQRIVVGADRRTAGPTGLSVLVDEVEMSLQDLAQLMISVSDNTATDVVLDLVGRDAVNATMRALGLEQTVIEGDCKFLLTRLVADLALSAAETEALGADDESVLDSMSPERWSGCRDLVAAKTNRSTAREITRLLEMTWKDIPAPAEQCAFVRRVMSQQVWPHRLRSGFPGQVKVSGKTGTLPYIRNEVGMVTYPDGGRYAVAVFTVAGRPDFTNPAADAVIGTAARIAVDDLRSRR
jgi:beta-lactamase class A